MRFAAVIFLALTCAAPAETPAARFDIVILHGEVIDSTGRPRLKADIAIQDGTIAAIGDLPTSATSTSSRWKRRSGR